MIPDTIPLYASAGRRLLEYIPRELAEQMRFRYQIVRSRSRNGKPGHIREAILRERRETVPLSNRGESFLQTLTIGRAWALRGVTGSERALGET